MSSHLLLLALFCFLRLHVSVCIISFPCCLPQWKLFANIWPHLPFICIGEHGTKMFTGDTNWLVLPRSLQSNLVSSRCSHWRSPNVPPPASLSVASAFSGEGASSPLPAAAFLMLEMEGSLKTPLLSTLFTRSPWLPWGWHAHTHLTSLPSHCPRQVNKGVNSQGTRMCHWQQWRPQQRHKVQDANMWLLSCYRRSVGRAAESWTIIPSTIGTASHHHLPSPW